MARAAQNRVQWRGVVDDLYSTRSNGHKQVSKCVYLSSMISVEQLLGYCLFNTLSAGEVTSR